MIWKQNSSFEKIKKIFKLLDFIFKFTAMDPKKATKNVPNGKIRLSSLVTDNSELLLILTSVVVLLLTLGKSAITPLF